MHFLTQAWVCSQKRQVICPAQAHRDQSNPKFQGVFARCFTCNFFSTMFFPLIHRNPNGYVYKNKDHGEKLSPGTIFHRARRENLSPGTIFHRARREKLSPGTIFHIAWRENLSPGTCFPSNLSGTGTLKVLDPILWSTLHFSTPLRPNHRRHTFTTAATVCLGCGLSLNVHSETYQRIGL